MAVVSNPRFPHSVRVYRVVGEDEFSPGEELLLYSGKCRNYTTRSSRTSMQTITSQYTLSIPSLVMAKAGDRVQVTDYTGEYTGVVTEATTNNIGDVTDVDYGGTNIYWNNYKR